MRRSSSRPKSILGQFTHEASELPKETGIQLVRMPGEIIKTAINQGTGQEIIKDNEGKTSDTGAGAKIADAEQELRQFANYKSSVLNPDFSAKPEHQPNAELTSIPKREGLPPPNESLLPSGTNRGAKTFERPKLSTHESKTGKQ